MRQKTHTDIYTKHEGERGREREIGREREREGGRERERKRERERERGRQTNRDPIQQMASNKLTSPSLGGKNVFEMKIRSFLFC